MTTAPKISAASLFRHEGGAHTVRVIKADQAGHFGLADKKPAANAATPHVHQESVVRMVGSGPDYCDLEIVCGCGEVTKFRCWNTEEKVAAK